jgi:transposase-like protein
MVRSAKSPDPRVLSRGRRDHRGRRQKTEGAKFFLAGLNDLHHRGAEHVLACCVDRLTGSPRSRPSNPRLAVEICIVHQIPLLNAIRRLPRPQKHRRRAETDLYAAVHAEGAEHALGPG